MQGGKRVSGRDYLEAAERNLRAARGLDTKTGKALQGFAREMLQRAHDALLVERGGGQAVPIT